MFALCTQCKTKIGQRKLNAKIVKGDRIPPTHVWGCVESVGVCVNVGLVGGRFGSARFFDTNMLCEMLALGV